MNRGTPSLAQLEAFAAVVDAGGFDAAAAILGVSTSAVSQRIRGLEATMGHVLLVRTSPPRVTALGERTLGTARQVVALLDTLTEAEAPARSVLPVAVGADALSTWLADVLSDAADWGDTVLRMSVEDQDVGHEALARGDVLGALSSLPSAQNGCIAIPLGSMRYVPVVSARLAQKHVTADGGLNLQTCPLMNFGTADGLQQRVLRAWAAERGVDAHPPTHMIGAQDGFIAGVRAGMGWGCIPEQMLAEMTEVGDIVRIPGLPLVDVALYWHRWATALPILDRFSAAVEAAAHRALRPF